MKDATSGFMHLTLHAIKESEPNRKKILPEQNLGGITVFV